MEITELLKKIKMVEADRDYSRNSKSIILSHTKEEIFDTHITVGEIISGVFRSGWAMALTAVFLFLAIGGFSVLKIFSPATTAVVDMTGLKAEARAIDTQIELTNIAYNASLGIKNETSTAAMASSQPAKQTVVRKDKISKQVSTTVENVAAQITIDSFLDALSQ